MKDFRFNLTGPVRLKWTKAVRRFYKQNKQKAHQGAQECERRRRQMAMGKIDVRRE